MGRGGRAQATGGIGGWRCQRLAIGLQQFAGNRMRGHAQADRGQPGTGQLAHLAPCLHGYHQRQGAGPEGLCQSQGAFIKPPLRLRRLQRGDVGDQGVKVRPALGCVNPRNRSRIRCIGREPVNGLGR